MLNAQVLVNRDWAELSGNPSASAVFSDWDLVDWTSSALDGQGNSITFIQSMMHGKMNI